MTQETQVDESFRYKPLPMKKQSGASAGILPAVLRCDEGQITKSWETRRMRSRSKNPSTWRKPGPFAQTRHERWTLSDEPGMQGVTPTRGPQFGPREKGMATLIKARRNQASGDFNYIAGILKRASILDSDDRTPKRPVLQKGITTGCSLHSVVRCSRTGVIQENPTSRVMNSPDPAFAEATPQTAICFLH